MAISLSKSRLSVAIFAMGFSAATCAGALAEGAEEAVSIVDDKPSFGKITTSFGFDYNYNLNDGQYFGLTGSPVIGGVGSVLVPISLPSEKQRHNLVGSASVAFGLSDRFSVNAKLRGYASALESKTAGASSGTSFEYGFGDISVGAKYRLTDFSQGTNIDVFADYLLLKSNARQLHHGGSYTVRSSVSWFTDPLIL